MISVSKHATVHANIPRDSAHPTMGVALGRDNPDWQRISLEDSQHDESFDHDEMRRSVSLHMSAPDADMEVEATQLDMPPLELNEDTHKKQLTLTSVRAVPLLVVRPNRYFPMSVELVHEKRKQKESEKRKEVQDAHGYDTDASDQWEDTQKKRYGVEDDSAWKPSKHQKFKANSMHELDCKQEEYKRLQKAVHTIWGKKRSETEQQGGHGLFMSIRNEMFKGERVRKFDAQGNLTEKYEQIRDEMKRRIARGARYFGERLVYKNSEKERKGLLGLCHPHDRALILQFHRMEEDRKIRTNSKLRLEVLQSTQDDKPPIVISNFSILQACNLHVNEQHYFRWGLPESVSWNWRALEALHDVFYSYANDVISNIKLMMDARGSSQMSVTDVQVINALIQDAGLMGLKPGLRTDQLKQCENLNSRPEVRRRPNQVAGQKRKSS